MHDESQLLARLVCWRLSQVKMLKMIFSERQSHLRKLNTMDLVHFFLSFGGKVFKAEFTYRVL